MYDKDKIKQIGIYCRNFRIDVFGLSLNDFCNKYGENIKNVSAFEHGKANNIKYVLYYLNECNEHELDTFSRGLYRIL